MLTTLFGTGVELVRVATAEDVRTFERRKVDAEDRQRTSDGWRAIAKRLDTGAEILVDAAYLRASGGWKEISDAFRALHGGTMPGGGAK